MNLKSYVKGIGVGMIVASLILIISGNLNKGMTDEDVIKRAKELGMVGNSSVIQNSDATEVAIGSTADSDGAASKENATDEKKTDNDANVKDNDSLNSNVDTDDTDTVTVSDSNKEGDSSVDSSKDNDSSNVTDDSKKDSDSSNVTDDSKKGNDSADVKDDSDSANAADTSGDKSDTNASATGETVKVEIKSGMSSESVAAAVMKAGLVDNDTEFNKYLCENGYDKRLRVGSFEIPKDSDFETISKHLCGIK